MTYRTATFTQEVLLPAPPQHVYNVLVVPQLHAAFTGQPALHTDRLDLDFLAYGTFLSGRNLELIPGQRVHLTWRAQMQPWPADHHSTVTYDLTPHPDGTRLRLTHAHAPEDLVASMAEGWITWYWQPLAAYLRGTPAPFQGTGS